MKPKPRAAVGIAGGVTFLAIIVGVLVAGSPPVVSVSPQTVSPGDDLELRVSQPPGVWDLAWSLERFEGGMWERAGSLIAGPGEQWEAGFDLGKPEPNTAIPLVGFDGGATMVVEIPNVIPGQYRIGQRFNLDGGGSLADRSVWHYAEFTVED